MFNLPYIATFEPNLNDTIHQKPILNRTAYRVFHSAHYQKVATTKNGLESCTKMKLFFILASVLLLQALKASGSKLFIYLFIY